MLKGASESYTVNKMRTHAPVAPARVMVLLPADDAERFTVYCSRNGFKKSTLIARLVREHLEREKAVEPGNRQPKAAGKGREA